MTCDLNNASSIRWMVAGSAILGSFTTLLFLAILYYILNRRNFFKLRMFGLDPAFIQNDSKFAFDNPYFKEDDLRLGMDRNFTHAHDNTLQLHSARVMPPAKMADDWPSTPSAYLRRRINSTGNLAAANHSLSSTSSDEQQVELTGRDITGLGFDICGNMRDGIYVRKVLKKGPAHDCGLIKPGDRIVALNIPFDGLVLEDAISLLNYASPYKLQLTLSKRTSPNVSAVTDGKRTALSSPTNSPKFELCYKTDHGNHNCSLQHPLYRSLSMTNVSKANNVAKGPLSKPSMEPLAAHPIDPTEEALKQIEQSMQYSATSGIWRRLKNRLNHVRRDTIEPIEKWWNHRQNRAEFNDQVMASKKHLELDAIVIGNNVFSERFSASGHVDHADSLNSRNNGSSRLSEPSARFSSNHTLNAFAYHNEAMEYSPEIQHKAFGSRLFSTSVDNRTTVFPSQPKRSDFFVHTSIDERFGNMAEQSPWTLNAMSSRYTPNPVDLHMEYLNNSSSSTSRKVSI